MKKKIIAAVVIVLLLGVFAVAFQFLCPPIVIECDYTLESLSYGEYKYYFEGDMMHSRDDFLKLRVNVSILNLTMFMPRWRLFVVDAPSEYENRISVPHDSVCPDKIDRLSQEATAVQIIINVKGLSDEEIDDFVEGLIIRTVDTQMVIVSEHIYDTEPIEFVLGDKLKK